MLQHLIAFAKKLQESSVVKVLSKLQNQSAQQLVTDNEIDTLLIFGQKLLSTQYQQEALDVFNQIISHRPTHFSALTYAAAILEQANQFEQALKYYQHALQIRNDNLVVASRIARCQLYLGQKEQAAALMNEVIKLEPENVNFVCLLAEINIAMGKSDEALTALTQQFAKHSESVELGLMLARELMQTQQFDQVEKVFQQLVKAYPNELLFQSYLAYTWIQQHAYERGRRLSIEILRKNKTQSKALVALGIFHFSVRANFVKARSYFLLAHRLDPQDIECLINIGYMSQKLKDYDLAINFYNKVLQLQPANREVRENIAIIHRDRNDFKRHFDWFDFRIKPKPANVNLKEWDGKQSLEGKSFLLLNEQGLGDLYNESWYFHLLGQIPCNVTIQVDPRTLKLFGESFPSFEFTDASNESLKESHYDFYLCRSSLGRLFWPQFYSLYLLKQTKWQNGHIRWLSLPNETKINRDEEIGKPLNIGISWRSGLQVLGRSFEYFTVEQFASLIAPLNANFVNLQYGIEQQERDCLQQALGNRISFPNIDLKDDQYQLADKMVELDCVLATCNAVLALASALGVYSIWTQPGTKTKLISKEFKAPHHINTDKLVINNDEGESVAEQTGLQQWLAEKKQLNWIIGEQAARELMETSLSEIIQDIKEQRASSNNIPSYVYQQLDWIEKLSEI